MRVPGTGSRAHASSVVLSRARARGVLAHRWHNEVREKEKLGRHWHRRAPGLENQRENVCVCVGRFLTEAAHTSSRAAWAGLPGRLGSREILTNKTTRKCAPPVSIAPRASGTRVYISFAAHLSRVAATSLICLCSFVNR
jgi:hypothetical protein